MITRLFSIFIVQNSLKAEVEVAAMLGSFPNEMASNDSESVDFKLML